MTKTNNQFNSLSQLKFVQDIDQETAANYSGGVGRINGAANDPDVILYDEPNAQGSSININAATRDGVPNLGDFNDKASSIVIKRGTWNFDSDSDYGFGPENKTILDGSRIRLGPGNYNLGENNNKISSAFRVN